MLPLGSVEKEGKKFNIWLSRDGDTKVVKLEGSSVGMFYGSTLISCYDYVKFTLPKEVETFLELKPVIVKAIVEESKCFNYDEAGEDNKVMCFYKETHADFRDEKLDITIDVVVYLNSDFDDIDKVEMDWLEITNNEYLNDLIERYEDYDKPWIIEVAAKEIEFNTPYWMEPGYRPIDDWRDIGYY